MHGIRCHKNITYILYKCHKTFLRLVCFAQSIDNLIIHLFKYLTFYSELDTIRYVWKLYWVELQIKFQNIKKEHGWSFKPWYIYAYLKNDLQLFL